MIDAEGEILCNKCGEITDGASNSKGVQRMILKLKTHCKTIIQENEDNDEGSDGNIITTHVRDNQCNWTGMIQEWQDHQKICPYLIISCDKCIVYKSQRQLMMKHEDECPQSQIQCPLSCGL